MPIVKDLHEYTPVLVRLIFSGPSVDPDLVTQESGVVPDEIPENIPSVGAWKFSRLETSEDDTEWGIYREWHKFLEERSEAFRKLKARGLGGYFSRCSKDYRPSAFLDLESC